MAGVSLVCDSVCIITQLKVVLFYSSSQHFYWQIIVCYQVGVGYHEVHVLEV